MEVDLLMNDFFATFGPLSATVATACEKMRDLGLTPDDVLRLYDEWMDEQMADMITATEADKAKAAKEVERARGDIRRHPGQADDEHRLGACPKCGSPVWGIKKCPHIAPPWRTFFACDGEQCAYHGRSRLTVEQLRRKWPEGAEVE